MATTTHEAKIVVSGQADGAVRALDETARATDRTTTAAEAAGAAQKQLARELVATKDKLTVSREAQEQAKRAQELFNGAVRAFGPASAEAVAAQKRLADATKAASEAAAAASKDVDDLGWSIARSTASAKQLTPALTRAAKEAERLGKEAERQTHELKKMELAQKGANKEALSYGNINFGGGRARGEIASITGEWTKQASVLDRMKTSMAGVGKTMLAGGALAAMLGFGAAMSDAAERALKVSAAVDAQTISIEAAKRSTQGLISNYNLTTAANSAVGLGVAKTDKEFAQLAESAAKLALKYGTDIPSSVSGLVTALGKGEPELLDNFGIVLKLSTAQEIYAASLGKTVQELTEEEKKSAFKVVGLQKIKEAAEASGVSLDTATAKLAAYNAKWENFKDSSSVAAVSAFGAITTAIESTTAAMYDMTHAGVELTPETEQWLRQQKELKAMAAEIAADDPAARHRAAMAASQKIFGSAGTTAYEETDREKKARERAEKEQEAWLDEQAYLQMTTYGPEKPKASAKKKGGKREKAASRESVEHSRTFVEAAYGDDIGKAAGVQAANLGIEEQNAKFEKEQAARLGAIDSIDRQTEALERNRQAMLDQGAAEQQQVDLVLWSVDVKRGAMYEQEEEMRSLQDERLRREREFADWQAQAALTEEDRDAARTRSMEVQARQRTLLLARENEVATKEQAKKLKLFTTVNNAMQTVGASMLQAIEDQAKGEKGAVAESIANFAEGIRNKMILLALQETALGVAAAAGIVTAGLAAPHFIAAGAATAAAAAAGGAQAGFHALAKSQGYGAEPAASGGEAKGDVKGRQMEGKAPGRSLEQQDVPVSWDDNRRANASVLQDRPPRPLTVVFNGPVVGAGGIEQVAATLKKMIDDGDQGKAA